LESAISGGHCLSSFKLLNGPCFLSLARETVHDHPANQSHGLQ
jgi:hypothetical protein